jgi:hypothetical protein
MLPAFPQVQSMSTIYFQKGTNYQEYLMIDSYDAKYMINPGKHF